MQRLRIEFKQIKKLPPLKHRILRRVIIVGSFILFTFIVVYLKQEKKREKVAPINILENIIKSDTLTAIVNCNSTNYFIYRGKPMGYQFDLLTLFANYLGVELKLIIENDIEKAFDMLNHHKCDVIAINLAVTKKRAESITFATSYGQTRQVLIQRKPTGWRYMSEDELDTYLIRNQLDLANQTVYVQSNSSFANRLKNLSNEIGAPINIKDSDDYDVEELIRKVAKGEILYTVADEDIAMLNKTYYQNIDTKTPISFPQKLAWAVAKNGSEHLLIKLNIWVSLFKNSPMYSMLYRKYFESNKASNRFNSQYLSIGGGKISPFDNYIKKYSKIPGYDWRIVASMIYQESRFNPNIESWAGAYGIMQLMPGTANFFGVSRGSSPANHIKAGCEFLKYLDNNLKSQIKDKNERIKFVLASYNVGLGHVLDARKLTKKYHKNPNIWDNNVDSMILKKSDPKYYLDPVVEYGYCRGQETFDYVKEIINRYEHYKNTIPE